MSILRDPKFLERHLSHEKRRKIYKVHRRSTPILPKMDRPENKHNALIGVPVNQYYDGSGYGQNSIFFSLYLP